MLASRIRSTALAWLVAALLLAVPGVALADEGAPASCADAGASQECAAAVAGEGADVGSDGEEADVLASSGAEAAGGADAHAAGAADMRADDAHAAGEAASDESSDALVAVDEASVQAAAQDFVAAAAEAVDVAADELGGSFDAAPPEAAVADGTYEIAPADDAGQRLDIASSPSLEGASAMLWHDHATQSQKWQLTRLDNGHYLVASLGYGRVLDLADPLGGDGAGLVQRTYNGSRSQEWILRAAADGSVRLQNAFSGRYIDVPYGNYGEAAVMLWQWEGSSAAQQRFSLVAATPVDDGYYAVGEAGSGLALVDSGGSVSTAAQAGAAASWRVEGLADGTLSIVNVGSHGVLGHNGERAATAAGSSAVWVVVPNAFGGLSLVPADAADRALGASGVLVAAGADAPLWTLASVQLIAEGSYAILVDGGGAVGLSSWSQDDGAYYTVYDGYWDGDALRFVVHVYEDNEVSFQSRYSGKYLTCQGSSVRQHDGDGSGAARFSLVALGSGRYAFAAADGTLLSVWGSDIGLSASGSGARQAFSLSAASGLSVQEKLDRLFAVADAEVGNTWGRKYEYALIEAGGSLCYTWDFWCATYVWWVFREAGLSPYLCGGSMTVYPQQQAGFYSDRDSFGWEPKPGDLAFYYFVPFPGGEYITHTEIVVSVDWEAGTVTTIGGNPVVCYNTRSIWDYRCCGYGGLNWGV